MKVDLSNGSSLSCQFYYTYQICEYFLLLRRNKLLCSDIVNFWGVEIPKLNIVFKGVSEGGRRGGGVLRFSFGGQLSAPIVIITP